MCELALVRFLNVRNPAAELDGSLIEIFIGTLEPAHIICTDEQNYVIRFAQRMAIKPTMYLALLASNKYTLSRCQPWILLRHV